MNKKIMFSISLLAMLLLTCSVLSAATITSSEYEGSGMNSHMGGAHAQPGSSITHNCTFTTDVTINVSDVKDKLNNFNGASSIKSLKVELNDGTHTENMENDTLTVDSAYMDGDNLVLKISGSKNQTIHSSSEISSMYNFDKGEVTGIEIQLDNDTITAKK